MKSINLFFLALLLVGANASAQKIQRGTAPEEGEPPYSGKRIALIVGINYEGSESLSKLNGAEADAQKVHDILQTKYGFESRLLSGAAATRSGMLAALTGATKGLTDSDCFLFYFAGHGEPDGKNFYLVPFGATARDSDSQLNVGDVLNKANKKDDEGFKARHALFLLDCCYSGRSLKWVAKNQDGHSIHKRKFWASGMQVITSGSRNQTVPDDSPFARAFVEALNTKMGTDSGMFTAREVFYDKIEKRLKGKEQAPQYGAMNLQRDGDTGGDFHFFPRGDWEHEPPTQTPIVYQTLTGPPGKWWFDEMPWLTPGLRHFLDGEQNVRTRVDPRFPPSKQKIEIPNVTTLVGIAGLRAEAEKRKELSLGGDIKLGLETLLAIRPEQTQSTREDAYTSLLSSFPTTRGNSGTTSHLKALLLHATGRDASEQYKVALESYRNESPGLCLLYTSPSPRDRG